MKCVVTGGCGFIGSHLVDRLVEQSHEVVVVDDLSTGDRSRLSPKATLIEGSITDIDLMASATVSAHTIFHTAALARIMRSVDDPVGTHHANVTGTLNVIKAAQINGVDRIVNSSSSSIYGDQSSHIMVETMTPMPKSPYGLQKLMGEQYASIFAKIFDIQIVSLRYFNVYGHRHSTEDAYALVIPHFLKLRGAGRPLTIYGDGTQTRAYTHVSDAVEANILAATTDINPRKHLVLNIGSAEETSVKELAKLIGGEIEYIVPNPRGAFEESRKSADSSKALAMIGWEPHIPLAKGIETLI